ncbi:MAG: DUF6356 family protein [Pseudomonadota bacterium]
MLKHFTQHPASVGESYGEHFLTASTFAVKLLIGAVVCSIHAVLPFMFEKTGSRIIQSLHDRMIINRARSSNTNTQQSARSA